MHRVYMYICHVFIYTNLKNQRINHVQEGVCIRRFQISFFCFWLISFLYLLDFYIYILQNIQ